MVCGAGAFEPHSTRLPAQKFALKALVFMAADETDSEFQCRSVEVFLMRSDCGPRDEGEAATPEPPAFICDFIREK